MLVSINSRVGRALRSLGLAGRITRAAMSGPRCVAATWAGPQRPAHSGDVDAIVNGHRAEE